MNMDIFEDLFVLEIANNHWGGVKRGLKIINEFGKTVKSNNIRAALKLQFRDVDNFIHKDFMDKTDIRYIKKTLDTKMTKESFEELVAAIRKSGCISMATPFDEKSVEWCVDLGIQIIKIASSDMNDWSLIEKIATTKKPVIFSTGGASLKDIDNLVLFLEQKTIPFALNHCVSLYPTEDHDLQLNQIDFLKNRYPGHVIGLSTHEYRDLTYSIMMAYAKGARTFERHIDINADGRPVSSYCSVPEQVDTWFKAWHKAKDMCGSSSHQRRKPSQEETKYLNALVRGVYAKRDLPAGHALAENDVYLAIPLQKGQISCRELMHGEVLLKPCAKDQPVMIDAIDSPYANHEDLKNMIFDRGI